jgi:uncharacterized protein (TIRG00374 family)
MLGLPRLRLRDAEGQPRSYAGPWRRRIMIASRFVRHSLGHGVRDGLAMMRERPIGVFAGSFGVMGFDLAVLGLCFKAFGYTPPVGVLVVGYLIGQLGGNVPLPGGIAGLDAGLIGVFALYHQPLAASAAAVLIYHAISLWIPGLLGSMAFVQLRRTLKRESQPAALCVPLAETIEIVRLPTAAAERSP